MRIADSDTGGSQNARHECETQPKDTDQGPVFADDEQTLLICLRSFMLAPSTLPEWWVLPHSFPFFVSSYFSEILGLSKQRGLKPFTQISWGQKI